MVLNACVSVSVSTLNPICRSEITTIAELELEFEVDDVAEYTDNTSAFAVEARKLSLKRDASGAVIEVTEENKIEYLQLYVQHRSVQH